MEEWVKEVLHTHTHTMNYYSSMRKEISLIGDRDEPEGILLSDLSETKKD